jgi:hypothetical protein
VPYSDPQKQREYARKHYRDNKEAYKQRAANHTKQQRARLRKFIWDFLRKNPCVDCGEADPVVLEFDHRDPASKRFNIGNAASGAYSLKTVNREMKKCDVRCANCHRRKTAIDFSWPNY